MFAVVQYLGAGAVVEFTAVSEWCGAMQNFDYPEGLKVYGSTQQIKDSLISMRSCRVGSLVLSPCA